MCDCPGSCPPGHRLPICAGRCSAPSTSTALSCGRTRSPVPFQACNLRVGRLLAPVLVSTSPGAHKLCFLLAAVSGGLRRPQGTPSRSVLDGSRRTMAAAVLNAPRAEEKS
ncbi:hypothetical protein NDU88_003286 [Pleurodeles waltl]|uniref:Uncharacterized protein n=1 Tax=Pleurodeles waltl TaxID=8319 RepID=A0AAV7SFK4_PLEWA|nr:hypothetical protein NDU88_003286 [Pleurodeles waltl]